MRFALDISGALSKASGLSFYVEQLITALPQVDPDNEYLLYAAFWRDKNRLHQLRRLIRAPNFRLEIFRFPQRVLLPIDEFGLRLQERWLRRRGVDLFHGLGHIVPPLSRIPSVVTIHHIGGISPMATRWDRFYLEGLTSRSIQQAAAVITVSEFSRREVLRRWSVDPQRVTVVLEGPPDPIFRPPEKRAASTRKGSYVLHVGSFQEHKNIPTLVQAFHRWMSRSPDRPERLVLVGHPGRDSSRVQALIHELKLDSRVDIRTGLNRAEIVRLYQEAEMVVVPSLLEGFGFPVLEAMACGAPVLSSTAASLPEIAQDAALLFEPMDAEGLSRMMERVATGPGLSEDLRRKGLERVRRFSWIENARQTVQIYHRVLSGSTKPT